jgi:mRNA interferase RelE/StbE
VGAATRVYYIAFDSVFFKFPINLQARIEAKIDEIGLRLDQFPHYRMTGSNRYRLRVGDYRVIYFFDLSLNTIFLLGVGHRREIYR